MIPRQEKVLEEPNTYPRWKVLDGQLYMYRSNLDIEEDLGVDDDAWKLVVPSEKRKKVLLEGRKPSRKRDMLSYMTPGGENRSSRSGTTSGKRIACCLRQLKG